jgi:hypothetical protein
VSRRQRAARLGAVFVIVLLSMAIGRLAAQSASAPVLKAAFIYNMAKFAEWPADFVGSNAPITLCVGRDDAVAQPLVDSVQGQRIGEHPVAVVRIAPDSPLRSCQLVFLSGLDARKTTKVLESLEGTAVFSVSDGDGFAAAGGVAQLFLEGDRLRFAINVDAAQRSRLRLSSKLLALAKIVHDERGSGQ